MLIKQGGPRRASGISPGVISKQILEIHLITLFALSGESFAPRPGWDPLVSLTWNFLVQAAC